ncbi:MAG TPA: GDSL-type esterase/lipase family protein [Candidatus Saccharimonadales bacterium]|nr:GDSL-type esterase/lipase family protein [Candidatus Saccharimonadales bacterium]
MEFVLVLILLIILAVLAVIVSERSKVSRTYDLAHNEPRHSGHFELGGKDKPNFRFLVLGDSIGSSCGVKDFNRSVGAQLAKKLSERFHVHYVNQAESGKWMGDFVQEQIDGHWDMIALIIGSNDVLHGIKPRFRKNVYLAVEKMKRHSPKVVIAGPGDASTVPLMPFWLRPLLKRRELKVAQALRKAAKRMGAVYANALEEPRLTHHIGHDHLHLNDTGDDILYRFIWSKIEERGWFK